MTPSQSPNSQSDAKARDLVEANRADDEGAEEPNTEGPGAVYYGRRQKLRSEGKTSEEVNEIEEGLREEGTLYEADADSDSGGGNDTSASRNKGQQGQRQRKAVEEPAEPTPTT